MKHTYHIRAKIWLYQGPAAWHFVTIPKKDSATLKEDFGKKLKRGWGSIPVKITLGKTTWQTSVFPDSKLEAYVLPLKAAVRKKENISVDDSISFTLQVNV